MLNNKILLLIAIIGIIFYIIGFISYTKLTILFMIIGTICIFIPLLIIGIKNKNDKKVFSFMLISTSCFFLMVICVIIMILLLMSV